jgi:hypothetical protein
MSAPGLDAGTINSLYQQILGRAADPTALAAWQAQPGASADALRSELAGSEEARNSISGIYQNTLGRAPDAGGLNANIQALAGGVPLSTLRGSIENSPENKWQDVIYGNYASLLGRPADPDGYNANLSLATSLSGQGYGEADIRKILQSGIVGSEEYRSKTMPKPSLPKIPGMGQFGGMDWLSGTLQQLMGGGRAGGG